MNKPQLHDPLPAGSLQLQGPIKGPFCWFSKKFEPPIIISLIFKKVHADETAALWFSSFSRLVQKNHTYFICVFEQFKLAAQSMATVFPSNNVYTGTPMALYSMNHVPVEMTTQPLVWSWHHMVEPKEPVRLTGSDESSSSLFRS